MSNSHPDRKHVVFMINSTKWNTIYFNLEHYFRSFQFFSSVFTLVEIFVLFGNSFCPDTHKHGRVCRFPLLAATVLIRCGRTTVGFNGNSGGQLWCVWATFDAHSTAMNEMAFNLPDILPAKTKSLRKCWSPLWWHRSDCTNPMSLVWTNRAFEAKINSPSRALHAEYSLRKNRKERRRYGENIKIGQKKHRLEMENTSNRCRICTFAWKVLTDWIVKITRNGYSVQLKQANCICGK